MYDQVHLFSVDHVETADFADVTTLPVEAAPAAPVQPEWRRFELPKAIWIGMLASYAVFFAAITMATGGSGRAVFAIVISVLYTLMFFGVATLLARQGRPDARSPLLRGEALPTWCGPMDARAVYGQILIVPMAVALFGVAVAIICAVVL